MNYCIEITAAQGRTHALSKQIEAWKTRDRPRDAKLSRQLRWLYERERELMRQAAREFAALNGWRWTQRRFTPSTLARGGTHDLGDRFSVHKYHLRLFDHGLYFRELARPYRAAAIVGQPYNTDPDIAREYTAELGLELELHVPPNITASWWVPERTRFFVFTRPGVSVQFLPEQQEVFA